MNRLMVVFMILLFAGVSVFGQRTTQPGVRISGTHTPGNVVIFGDSGRTLVDGGVGPTNVVYGTNVQNRIAAIESTTNLIHGAVQADSNWTNVSISATNLYINAKFYGAVGDANSVGAGTDDTAALQAAMDASEAQKLPLYIPSGRYRISAAITNTVSSGGVIIYGAGEGRTIIHNVTDGADSFVIDSTDDGNEAIVVRDMTITRTWASSETGTGLWIAGGSGTMARCQLSGLQINFYNIGLWLNECDQSSVAASRFASCATGVLVDGNSNAVNFDNIIINDNSTVGINLQQGTGVKFTACDMGNSNHATPQMRIENSLTVVDGCNFEMHKDAPAIVTEGYSQLRIRDNVFANIAVAGQDPTWNYPAVEMDDGGESDPNLVFEGNIVVGSTAPAVRVWDENIQVRGTPYYVDPDATVPAGTHYQIVSGIYPAISSVVDNRSFSPFSTSTQDPSVNSNQVGLVFWKVDLTSGEDDLLTVFPTSPSTYKKSSLLNEKMYSATGNWTGDQTFDNVVITNATIEELSVNGESVYSYTNLTSGTWYRSQVWASCGIDSTSIVLYAKADLFAGNAGEYFGYTDTDAADETHSFVGRLLSKGSFTAPNDTSNLPTGAGFTATNGVMNWETIFGAATTVYWAHLEMASRSTSSEIESTCASTPWSFVTTQELNAGGHAGFPIVADAEVSPDTTIMEIWVYGSESSKSLCIWRPISGSGGVKTLYAHGQGGGSYSAYLLTSIFNDNKRVLMPANQLNTPATGNRTPKQLYYKIQFIENKEPSTVYLTNP